MTIKTNPAGLFGFGLLAFLLALAPFQIASGVQSPALLPVPEINLENFEPGVRKAMIDGLETVERNRSASADKQAQSYGRLAMLFHAHDLLEAAEPCYVNAGMLAPTQYQWPYLLAFLNQVEGRLAKAEAQYKTALKLNPG